MDRTLSIQEAQEDFALYLKLLQETHPGLYRYQSEQDLQRIIGQISEAIQKPLGFYDFYKSLAYLNANIQCSHSFVLPTEDFERYLLNQVKTLPFYFIPIQGKVYVLFSGIAGDTVKPGFELLGINGKPVQEVMVEIRKHVWSDGEIELGKNFALQGNLFPLFYYAFIDRPNTFRLDFVDSQGSSINVEVPALSGIELNKYYKKNPVNKKVFKAYSQPKRKSWELIYFDDLKNTACLSLRAFGSKKINTDDAAQKAIRAFMDKSLAKLEQKNIENLIIDLRYNAGGWDIIGVELLSYLLKKDSLVGYYGPMYATMKDATFLKYSDLAGYDFETLQEELIPQTDGTFRLKEAYSLSLGEVGRKPNAFVGNVYFLIDEYTASAASEFAAVAKTNQIGIFIGTETNGTFGGQNGTSFIQMPLPHSGIFVRTPLVKGHLMVNEIQALNRGVLPDYEVTFSIQDVLKKDDVQLAFVKKLILKE